MLKFCLRLQLILVFIAASFFIIQKAHANQNNLTITGVEIQKNTQNNLRAVSNIQTQPGDFVTISLSPIADFNFRDLYQNFPWGLVTLGAVLFDIAENSNGIMSGHGVIETTTISINPIKAKTVYLLLNSWDTWVPYDHLKLGEVSINFEDGTSQKLDLVIGENIREWRHGNDIYPTVNTITSTDSTEVFTGNPSSLAGPAVLDMLQIEIDQSNLDKNVTSLSITDSLIEVKPNTPTDPNLFWAGLTLEEVTQQNLAVPYFSQKDSQWGLDEYDHGNTEDLWCGTTMSQCGCAVTSAAMLLKYYGVDRSPDGSTTSPKTLNDWLKGRTYGYIKGNINWQEIARYAKDASELYGNSKLDYLGVINEQNLAILDSDLNSDKPVILEVPNHFIVAKGILKDTHAINDPILATNTTLESYNNSFQGIRRFELTNTNLSAIILSIPSPGEIIIMDSMGRKLGQDPVSGQIFNEIPNGNYYLQEPLTDDSVENSPLPPEGSGNYYIEILDPQEDNYTIRVDGISTTATFLAYDKNADLSSQVVSVANEQEYVIDYSPEPESDNEFVQQIDLDVIPWSSRNIIFSSRFGILPVAIKTTPSFNASTVDVSSIRLGRGEAKPLFDKGFLIRVDKDRDRDLFMLFSIKDIDLRKEDEELCITGQTKDGLRIKGCDQIKLLK